MFDFRSLEVVHGSVGCDGGECVHLHLVEDHGVILRALAPEVVKPVRPGRLAAGFFEEVEFVGQAVNPALAVVDGRNGHALGDPGVGAGGLATNGYRGEEPGPSVALVEGEIVEVGGGFQ